MEMAKDSLKVVFAPFEKGLMRIIFMVPSFPSYVFSWVLWCMFPVLSYSSLVCFPSTPALPNLC